MLWIFATVEFFEWVNILDPIGSKYLDHTHLTILLSERTAVVDAEMILIELHLHEWVAKCILPVIWSLPTLTVNC